MNEQIFNGHVLIDFNNLFVNDTIEIQRLQQEFERNGWCFIRLPNQNSQLVDKLNNINSSLSVFFARQTQEKSQYESSNAFGYSRVHHKEGIRVLMDEHGLGKYHYPLTSDVEEILKDLSILLATLLNVLKSVIFQMPVLAHSPDKDKVSLSSLCMLDIVHYYNERIGPVKQPKIGFNTNEVNCVPHFDPGLFSLSILSTCDGLQLKDIEQDESVVWTK